MASSTAPTQLRRLAALARLEAEELVDAVSELRSASDSKGELERAVKRVEALSARIQKTLDVPDGLTVAQVAARLQVSEPTVRKWSSEGLLKAIPGRKPVELSQRSVIELERVLEQVRQNYPAARWSKALAAFLHDRDLLDQVWSREGIKQLRRGELLER